jgi:preprotein translocase subunit SecG
MQQVLMFLLIIVALAMVGLVLMQQGKGADIGASFGSGASNSVFGSQGSGSFLMKLTFALAAVFFIICIVLARMAVVQSHASSQFTLPTQSKSVPAKSTSGVPMVPNKSSKTVSNQSNSVPTIPKK